MTDTTTTNDPTITPERKMMVLHIGEGNSGTREMRKIAADALNEAGVGHRNYEGANRKSGEEAPAKYFVEVIAAQVALVRRFLDKHEEFHGKLVSGFLKSGEVDYMPKGGIQEQARKDYGKKIPEISEDDVKKALEA